MDRESRVVVGVDHSEGSLRALGFAVDEAVLRNVELEVVWAWSDHPAKLVAESSVDGLDVAALAQVQLDELVADRVPEEIGVTVRAVTGEPASVLVDSARNAGLLVVGARGAGGFLGLQLGSVSWKVANHAACPVAVVHAPADEPASAREPRIVVGVDGSDHARNALRWALGEASLRSVSVSIVHGWMYPAIAMSHPGFVSPIDAIEKAAKELTDAELEWAEQHDPDLDVSAEPVCAGAASTLIEASRSASLLVVGSAGLSGLVGRLLGSVAQQVVRHAACPVVVVPPPGTAEPPRK